MKHLLTKITTKKAEMSHLFQEDGRVIPVTRLVCGEGISLLQQGDNIRISGIVKGRGFAGVVKRWGFAGGPATHGSGWERKGGSIGAGTTPGRVYRGKKMSGRFGGNKKTVDGLSVVRIDSASQSIFVSGSVPGHRNSVVMVHLLPRRSDI